MLELVHIELRVQACKAACYKHVTLLCKWLPIHCNVIFSWTKLHKFQQQPSSHHVLQQHHPGCFLLNFLPTTACRPVQSFCEFKFESTALLHALKAPFSARRAVTRHWWRRSLLWGWRCGQPGCQWGPAIESCPQISRQLTSSPCTFNVIIYCTQVSQHLTAYPCTVRHLTQHCFSSTASGSTRQALWGTTMNVHVLEPIGCCIARNNHMERGASPCRWLRAGRRIQGRQPWRGGRS